jgi:hypothetical protein
MSDNERHGVWYGHASSEGGPTLIADGLEASRALVPS